MPPVERLVVVVRPSRSARATADVARWIRKLLPAALLLVTPSNALFLDAAKNVITLDADDVVSGPLTLADELLRLVERSSG